MRNFILMVALILSLTGCWLSEPAPLRPVEHHIIGDSVRIVWTTNRLTSADAGITKTRPFEFEDKLIFFYDSTAHCINKRTGETVWTAECDAETDIYPSPCFHAVAMPADNDFVYVVGERFVQCLRLSDGSPQWHFEVTDEVIQPDVGSWSQSSDALFLTLIYSDELIALSKATGQILWRKDVYEGLPGNIDRPSSWPGSASYFDGKVYIGYRLWPGDGFVAYDGALAAFDALTGKNLWIKRIPAVNSSITGGEEFWNSLTSNISDEPIHCTSDGLYLTSGHTIMHTDFSGNILWRRVVVSDIVHVAQYAGACSLIEGDHILAYNNGPDAFLVSLNLSDGGVFWSRRVSARGEDNTILGEPPQVDGSSIYKVTDGGWLIGQDVNTGANTWATLLPSVATSLKLKRGYNGCYKVQGNLAYYLNSDHIVCIEKM